MAWRAICLKAFRCVRRIVLHIGQMFGIRQEIEDMGFSKDTDYASFVDNYSQEMLERRAAVFVGAGLSVPCGFPTWDKLVEPFAKVLGLTTEAGKDLTDIVDYYKAKFPPAEIAQRLVNVFDRPKAMPSQAHYVLASLPIETFWTTNYDCLIERALANQGKTVDVKVDESRIYTHTPKRSAVLYKMHGDVLNPKSIVLAKSDYEEYDAKHRLFPIVLKNDLLQKTFLFVGFSFNDPNMMNVVAQIRVNTDNTPRTHYCIYKRITLNEYNGNQEAFQQAQRWEELRMEQMRRYGINFILIDDYSEIIDVLNGLKFRFMRKKIFISGSAEKYDPLTQAEAEYFIYNLSFGLSQADYGIVSGFGLGVGSSVINGVLSYTKKTGASFADRLHLYPFPQNIDDPEKRKEQWTIYRKEMLSQAGIAIFIFGNKRNGDDFLEANGMLEEFQIAKELGLVVIPVSQTGYASSSIWNQINDELDSYYPNAQLRAAVRKLQDVPLKQVDKLIKHIIETVNIAQN